MVCPGPCGRHQRLGELCRQRDNERSQRQPQHQDAPLHEAGPPRPHHQHAADDTRRAHLRGLRRASPHGGVPCGPQHGQPLQLHHVGGAPPLLPVVRCRQVWAYGHGGAVDRRHHLRGRGRDGDLPADGAPEPVHRCVSLGGRAGRPRELRHHADEQPRAHRLRAGHDGRLPLRQHARSHDVRELDGLHRGAEGQDPEVAHVAPLPSAEWCGAWRRDGCAEAGCAAVGAAH
mmetsp:Transcript_97378/g.303232  ORF Transcript_97378/g.303232 Transcript_97378/m.303232 type:complete len:231 (+) Transcript_97378:836-1528(+)